MIIQSFVYSISIKLVIMMLKDFLIILHLLQLKKYQM